MLVIVVGKQRFALQQGDGGPDLVCVKSRLNVSIMNNPKLSQP